MLLPLNRREMLGACGIVGAAATAAALASTTAARGDHVELGRFVRRAGVQGKMTGAQAAAAALACEGVPCVFGIPGRQNNELWDAFKARGSLICWSPTSRRPASWPTPRRGRPARSASSRSCRARA